MKTLLGVFLARSILIIGSGCGESSTSAEGTTAKNESSSSTPTPEERVEEEVGDEVQAGGYAGDLDVKNVSFDGTEAQVTVKTPEGASKEPAAGI